MLPNFPIGTRIIWHVRLVCMHCEWKIGQVDPQGRASAVHSSAGLGWLGMMWNWITSNGRDMLPNLPAGAVSSPSHIDTSDSATCNGNGVGM